MVWTVIRAVWALGWQINWLNWRHGHHHAVNDPRGSLRQRTRLLDDEQRCLSVVFPRAGVTQSCDESAAYRQSAAGWLLIRLAYNSHKGLREFSDSHLQFRSRVRPARSSAPTTIMLRFAPVHKYQGLASILSSRTTTFVVQLRGFATPADASPTKTSKVWDSIDEAVKDVKSGDVLLCGGVLNALLDALLAHSFSKALDLRVFQASLLMIVRALLTGCPDTLLGALAKRKDEVTNLTGVSNNSGGGDSGLGSSCVVSSSAKIDVLRRQAPEYQPTQPCHRIIPRKVRTHSVRLSDELMNSCPYPATRTLKLGIWLERLPWSSCLRVRLQNVCVRMQLAFLHSSPQREHRRLLRKGRSHKDTTMVVPPTVSPSEEFPRKRVSSTGDDIF